MEIITAYPDLENCIATGEYFSFNNEEFQKKITKDSDVWKLFKFLNNKHKFELRPINSNRPCLRVYLHNYLLKFKKNKLVLVDSSCYNPKFYEFNIPAIMSEEKILKLITEIENFKESYSIFGSSSIEEFVSGHL